MLLGECKWGQEAVELDVVRDLTERKIPLALKVLPEEEKSWTVHPAFFARDGLTPAAHAYARELTPNPMLTVSLKMIDHDLGRVPGKRYGQGRKTDFGVSSCQGCSCASKAGQKLRWLPSCSYFRRLFSSRITALAIRPTNARRLTASPWTSVLSWPIALIVASSTATIPPKLSISQVICSRALVLNRY